MAKRIMIAGKAGVGKTYLSAFLIEYLIDHKKGTILALDADPNPHLNNVLGDEEIPDVREKGTEGVLPRTGYDLLVLGLQEDEIAVRDMIKGGLDDLATKYDYVIINAECDVASEESLLKRTDYLILASDDSVRAVKALVRLKHLEHGLKANIPHTGVIVNRAPNGALTEAVAEIIENNGLHLYGIIPNDEAVFEYSSYGQPITTLPLDTPMRVDADDIFDKIGL